MSTLTALALAVVLATLPPGGTFVDDNGHDHEGSIEAIAAEGITQGCNPPANDRFCPDQYVTRGAMAAFVVRALRLPPTRVDYFHDDSGHVFENAVNRLAAAGITQGCRPPTSGEFCISQTISRGATAAILARAFDLPAGRDRFADDEGHLFENAINRLAAAGITEGCNPPANDQFCPDRKVTRAEMATMFSRALGLRPSAPPPVEEEPPTDSANPGSNPPSPATPEPTPLPAPDNPPGETHLVISQDTVINERLVLRGGDTIEFRNGAQLMFGPGGYADWRGTPTSTWSNDGKTQNLTRDIKLTGRGSVMFMAGSLPSTITYVEVDLQPAQELRHYPLHWHHVGNGSRGTLVEGVVVKNSTNRAFVPHGSHGITFRDTIAKNIQGDAYWWDPPEFQSSDTSENSHDILFDHALADGVTNHFEDDRGYRLSAFKLGSGNNNTVRNSVALNVSPSHPKNCAGFFWPEEQGSTWTFQNNASFDSACNGIFVWQNNSNEHIIDGFRGDGIEHGAYKNRYDYRNVDVDFVIVHAVGWSITGGSIDQVRVSRHTLEGDPVVFSNVSIGSFVIDNTSNGGSTPATYVLNNTGLSCGDIDYRSVVPGTRVLINGSQC